MNIPYLSLHEVSDLIRSKSLSPVEVVDACLARIEQLNPKLNTFITVLADEARAQALQAEEEIKSGNWRGPLHGIPVAFKDMYDTAGVKTTAAFEHFANRVPGQDAAAVAKLKEAGAIIIGKTNMHTLAMGTTSNVSFYGAVHNPWDSEYIAGGSSGGSAAAVATGMCYATIDTDAVGSCRLPAACCGVVGFKCTWGLLDNTGILAGEQADPVILQLATAGITTRDAEDTALVVDALAGTDFGAAVDTADRSLRIGVVANFGATDPIRAAFSKAVTAVQELGYTTTQVNAPFSEAPDMANMTAVRKTANQDIFTDVDVLILPTTAAEVPTAVEVGEDPQALSPQNTFFANYYGLPAISVPCGLDGNGLPIGLQIVGKLDDDLTVLRLAKDFLAASGEFKHPK
jgi:aspartyl-tRNA(Asn)/glutamyl-tRNA(Gln) amidotransferase subunit A